MLEELVDACEVVIAAMLVLDEDELDGVATGLFGPIGVPGTEKVDRMLTELELGVVIAELSSWYADCEP